MNNEKMFMVSEMVLINRKMTSLGKLIYILIANSDGNLTIQTMAEILGASLNGVIKQIKRLEEDGFIRTNRGYRNSYEIVS